MDRLRKHYSEGSTGGVVSRNAATTPIPKPNKQVSFLAPRSNTTRRAAPRRARCEFRFHVCAATPNMRPRQKIPTAASTRAIALNEPSRKVRNRSCEIDWPRASFKDSISVTGSFLSMEWTAWRMHARTYHLGKGAYAGIDPLTASVSGGCHLLEPCLSPFFQRRDVFRIRHFQPVSVRLVSSGAFAGSHCGKVSCAPDCAQDEREDEKDRRMSKAQAPVKVAVSPSWTFDFSALSSRRDPAKFSAQNASPASTRIIHLPPPFATANKAAASAHASIKAQGSVAACPSNRKNPKPKPR